MTPPMTSSVPTVDSPVRFIAWQARRQRLTLLGGMAFGIVWMLCQAMWPLLVGRAIDGGLDGDYGVLVQWCVLLLVVAIVQAASGALRHRMAVSNLLASSLGVSRLIGHHSASTGRALVRRSSAGEVVSAVASDSMRLGEMFDVTARLGGSIVAYVAVTIIMIGASLPIGLGVALGVPLVVAVLMLTFQPAQRRALEWREQTGRLTGLGADTVVGLRILRGVGGERVFARRYAAQSQRVREAGVRMARFASWVDALQVLLPGGLVVFVVGAGASFAAAGEISPGQLATLYGYATFLILPLRTGVEASQAFARGTIAARRVTDVLRTAPAVRDEGGSVPDAGTGIIDDSSGVAISPGVLNVVVDADADAAAALVTRFGRFDDDELRRNTVHWGGIDLRRVPLDEIRRRIVVSEAHPHLFEGPLLDGLDIRTVREPEFTDTSTGRIRRVGHALEVAAATETVEALPKGIHDVVAERGRTFSGGQRQRLSLARAILADAEVLVLIDPTSAVDTHTESLIAARLKRARDGSTTVVTSASPIVLEHADEVHVVRKGRLQGTGTHAQLVSRTDRVGRYYRRIVERGAGAAHDRGLDEAWTGAIDVLWDETHEEGGRDAAADR